MSTQQQSVMNIGIDGMSCGHCVSSLTKALASLPDVEVKEVVVGHARVKAASPQAEKAVLVAIDDAGFTVRSTQSQPAAKTGCCCGNGPCRR